MISYSAPGKIILSGEHGVVYGKPALAVAIKKRLTCSIAGAAKSPQSKSAVHVISKVREWLEKKGINLQKNDPHLLIKSNIPSGRGMGSSAAYSVAGAAAVYEYFTGQIPEKNTVNDIAYQIEKKFHTNPSGVDVSASCQGGLIYYRKEFEFLKTISALNIKIPKTIEERLFLIDTGKPAESTAVMVSQVGKQFNKNPTAMRALFENMERVTKRMVVALVKEDFSLFAECISENQRILESIGVVSASTMRFLSTLDKYGAAKITGAGGSTKGSGFAMILSSITERSDSIPNAFSLAVDYLGLIREQPAE